MQFPLGVRELSEGNLHERTEGPGATHRAIASACRFCCRLNRGAGKCRKQPNIQSQVSKNILS